MTRTEFAAKMPVQGILHPGLNRLLKFLHGTEPSLNAFLHALAITHNVCPIASLVPHRAAIDFSLCKSKLLQLSLEALKTLGVSLQNPCKDPAIGAGSQKQHRSGEGAVIWKYHAGRPHQRVKPKASQDINCQRHGLDDQCLVLVGFQKGRHFEQTPQPLAIGHVPNHQQSLGMLQTGSDVQHPFGLCSRICLVDAESIQKHHISRRAEKQHQHKQ
mmetsp:Transcript_82666/g.198376  ORF Transcript_82666/g.198376 Transcript_82666/m.198376 type:complete len:216 (+) Transcript_82666:132-779(+)